MKSMNEISASIILTIGFILGPSSLAQASNFSKIGSQSVKDPVVVVAIAKVKAGKEADFKSAVLEILAPTSKEKGAILFVFNESTTSTTEFAFYEQWETQADLDAHLKSLHMQSFFELVGESFEPGYPSIKTYRQREK